MSRGNVPHPLPLLRLLFPLVLFTGMLISQGAQGKGLTHQLEVGGFVGGYFFSPSNELGRLERDPLDSGLQHSALLGLRLGYGPISRVMLEAELGVLPTSTRDGTTQVVALSFRGNLLVHLLTGRVRPFLLVGAGGISSVSSSDTLRVSQDTDEEVHLGAGLKVDLGKRLGLRLDGRALLVPRIDDASLTPEGEVSLSVFGRFSLKNQPPPPPPPKDQDGDGIYDDRDLCPGKAEDKDGYRDSDGCPDLDDDNDGVEDANDRCAREPGVRENGGCPDTDKDQDGVLDRLDACPEQPGKSEDKGCPPPDADKDGILDKDDKCKDQPGPQSTLGCPDQDNDGIADTADRCPDKAENRNDFQDDDGCPDEAPERLNLYTGDPRNKGIKFKKGTAELTKGASKPLDRMVKVLQRMTDLQLMISGHVDPKEKAEEGLAKARAEAVKAYFLQKGIGSERLVALDRPPSKNK